MIRHFKMTRAVWELSNFTAPHLHSVWLCEIPISAVDDTRKEAKP